MSTPGENFNVCSNVKGIYVAYFALCWMVGMWEVPNIYICKVKRKIRQMPERVDPTPENLKS